MRTRTVAYGITLPKPRPSSPLPTPGRPEDGYVHERPRVRDSVHRV